MNPVRRSGFWLIAGLTLLCMAVTAALGIWQLARAQQKRVLEEGIAQQAALAPMGTDGLLAARDAGALMHRAVALSGHWLQGTTLFLDNRPMGGRTGFIVLSALRLEGSDRAVLVQRGWVPRDFVDRTRLPEVPTPQSPVRIQGRLAPAPSQLFELGTGAQGVIRQNVDLAALAGEWRIPLLMGVSVLQLDADDTGLVRDWPRFVGGQHKHWAYAAQWFAMCAVIGGLFFWFQIYLPRSRRTSHGSDAR